MNEVYHAAFEDPKPVSHAFRHFPLLCFSMYCTKLNSCVSMRVVLIDGIVTGSNVRVCKGIAPEHRR